MGRLQLNVPELQRSQRQIPLQEIVKVMGNNPIAQGINAATDPLADAVTKHIQHRKEKEQTKQLQSLLNPEDPIAEDSDSTKSPSLPDISALSPDQLFKVDAAKTAKEKASSYDFAGLSADKSNAIVLNKHTGALELKPLPGGFSPKTPPAANQSGVGSKEEEAWTKLGDHVNNLRQSSRSALGAASIANQRADRALTVLANPNATNQDLNNVLVDLGGIFQGGSPHETALNASDYNTLKTKINNLMTYVTSNPQAAKQPAVQAKLREVVTDIKNVDNKIVKNNLGIVGVQFESLIKNNPQRWQRMVDAVNQTTVAPTDLPPIQSSGLSPAAQALINKHK